ncbi:MAG: 2Fe-2S iron-sulfur cluster-binding protein [Gammaproteobacteria bacterium]|nr:2Fe-2S iron-sulfur cluster-binding protein [Gammaproteobacteria bacterium]
MGHQFAEIAFTETVRDIQQALGSRAGYASMEEGPDYNHRLGEREAGFIAARDSFYMASVSETGWPYLQHRGGPAGFMRVIDEATIGFADFSGNRQYVSTGNFMNNDRVALFFMDYPNRTRLKLLGRVRVIAGEDYATLARLEVDDYRARVERGFLIQVEAFDWNCPQHITPRYTEDHVATLMAPLLAENRALKATGNAAQRRRPGALGDGPLALQISGVRQLTPRVRAFELRHPKSAELPAVEAGSHLRVPVVLENGESAVRHYSICSNPARRDVYEIAVLREEEGAGGSRAVYEQFELGVELHCETPQNHFQLHSDERPTVLIAGGIGITPIKAMAQTVKARGGELQLHYAGRSRAEMPFLDRLEREFGDSLSVYSAADRERLDIEQVLSTAPADAKFYLCGPGRLLDAVTDVAVRLNIAAERIHFERFEAAANPDARPVQVELRRSGILLQVPAEQSILDAALEAGVDAPFSCKLGDCRTCAVKVLDGEAEHRDNSLSDYEREQQGLMCPCVSRATGDKLVLEL